MEALDVFAKAACPDSRLLVVGQGDLVPRWQRHASELNLQERVEFRGFVSNVGRELARMDVLLHLPKPGGSATADLALQEALMAGWAAARQWLDGGKIPWHASAATGAVRK